MNLRKHWVPLMVVGVGALAGVYLAQQDKTVKVNEHWAPAQPAPPVLVPPMPGQEQAFPGRNNPGPAPSTGSPTVVPVPGGVFRSLDKLNAAAKAVGCPVLVPGDPASRLLDQAECFAEKASAPGQKK